MQGNDDGAPLDIVVKRAPELWEEYGMFILPVRVGAQAFNFHFPPHLWSGLCVDGLRRYDELLAHQQNVMARLRTPK